MGESTGAPFGYMLENVQEGLHKLYGIAYDEGGLSSKSQVVAFVVSNREVLLVGSSWENLTIPDQEGVAVSFDAIPTVDNMNGVIE